MLAALVLLVAQAAVSPLGKSWTQVPNRNEAAARIKLLVLEPDVSALSSAERGRLDAPSLTADLRIAAADTAPGLHVVDAARTAVSLRAAGSCLDSCALAAARVAGADFAVDGILASGGQLRLRLFAVKTGEQLRAATLRGSTKKELQEAIDRKAPDLFQPLNAAIDREIEWAGQHKGNAPAPEAKAEPLPPTPERTLPAQAPSCRAQSGEDGVPKEIDPTGIPPIPSCESLASDLKLAVLEFTVTNLPEADRARIVPAAIMQAARDAGNRVVPGLSVSTTEQVNLLMAGQIDPSKCADDLCAVQIGQKIGVEFVVDGTFRKEDASYTANLRLWTTAAGGGQKSGVRLRAATQQELLAAMDQKAAELFGPVQAQVWQKYNDASRARAAAIQKRVVDRESRLQREREAAQQRARAEASAKEEERLQALEEAPRRAFRRKLGYGAMGVALLGGLGVVGLGVRALSVNDRIQKGDYKTAADLKAASDGQPTLNLATRIVAITAGAFAVTGVTLVLFSGERTIDEPGPPRAAVTLGVQPGFAFVRGEF